MCQNSLSHLRWNAPQALRIRILYLINKPTNSLGIRVLFSFTHCLTFKRNSENKMQRFSFERWQTKRKLMFSSHSQNILLDWQYNLFACERDNTKTKSSTNNIMIEEIWQRCKKWRCVHTVPSARILTKPHLLNRGTQSASTVRR